MTLFILKGPMNFDADFTFERKEGYLIVYKLEEDTVTNMPQVVMKHEETFSLRVLRTVCNCFFDGQRKRSNSSVVDDNVQSFKKSKRCKE